MVDVTSYPSWDPPPPNTNRREPEERKPRTWDFDADRLLALIDEADRANAVRRVANDAWREMRDRVSWLKAELRHQALSYDGRTSEKDEARLVRAEQELARRAHELSRVTTEYEPIIALAQRCRSWAEERGWTIDGEPPGRDVDQVLGTEPPTPW